MESQLVIKWHTIIIGGILPQVDSTLVKVAPSSRAAGHGHGGKDNGFIPPHGNNTAPKVVASSMNGRIDLSTPHSGIGSPNQDDCGLSIQASNVFFAVDDGKRPKLVNSSKDQDG